MACREGLAPASDLLIQKFRLVGDYASVVKNLQGGSYEQIIREINAGRGRFEVVEVVHESRTSNIDAGMLARSLIYIV